MEAVVWDLARQFVRDGIGVTLLTTSIPGRPESFEEEGVIIVALKAAPPRRYTNQWWRASRIYFRDRLMHQADGVLSVSAAGYGLLSLRWRIPDVPFVMQAHGTSLGEFISKVSLRSPRAFISSIRNIIWLAKDLWCYRHFNAVVAVGSRVYKDLTRLPIRWCLPTDRVRLIPNGIDTNMFSPNPKMRKSMRDQLGWPEKNIRIVVSASRLHKQKGVELGLRAYSHLEKRIPELRCLIVGDGPELANLQAEALALHVADKVRFVGAVPRNQLVDYLRAGDVFLLTTTRVEGLPLNVLEALSVGLPVVISEHLNMDHDMNGHFYSVNPNDCRAVASALENALMHEVSDVGQLPDMYSLNMCAQAYRKLFEELLPER
jgi:glycosyltransferase involved in cell wall biosynthesis